MPNFIVILFNHFSLYSCGIFNCKGCVWESVKTQVESEEQVDFTISSREANSCRVYDWNVKSHDSLEFLRISCRWGLPSKYSRNILFGYFVMFALPSLYPHYIYPYYSHIVRSVFQRENLRNYPWELEIVIPTIIYTFPCGFSLFLLLHIQILERLIAQTLTTPNLSVKWGLVLLESIGRSQSLADAIELNCVIQES